MLLRGMLISWRRWLPSRLGLKDALSGRLDLSNSPGIHRRIYVSSPVFDKSDFTSVNIKFDIVKIEGTLFNRITIRIGNNYFLDYVYIYIYICGLWQWKSWNKGMIVS